jgi:spermidine/putrescine transport system permease protein
MADGDVRPPASAPNDSGFSEKFGERAGNYFAPSADFFLERRSTNDTFSFSRTCKEQTHEEMSHPPAFGKNFARRCLAGWTYAVMALLYLPIVLLIVYSFNKSPLSSAWQGATLRWYKAVWADQNLVDAIENSLIVATAATVLSVILGTLAAWLLHRYKFPAASAIYTALVTPMIIPEVIMGVSLMLFFRAVGVELGFTTVIIAHVTFCFPFVMAAVQARLAGLDPSLEEAAMDLGATPAVAFFSVILPYLTPGIIAGAMLAFTLSLDEFVVTYFTYDARSMTLPVRIYSAIHGASARPELNAVSTLFIVATAILVVGADAAKRKRSE